MSEKFIESMAANFPADAKEILLKILAQLPHGCGACAHAEWGGWIQHKYDWVNDIRKLVPGASKKVFFLIGCRAGLIGQLPPAYIDFGGEQNSLCGRHPAEFCTSQNAGLGDSE